MEKDNMDKSILMQDMWGSNHGYEAMLDFQMSWLLQVAKGYYNAQLLPIARKVLLKLIDRKDYANVEINRVDVWRQWNNIDVLAEIDVTINGKEEHHIVVIEDKAYTMIHDNQLVRYKKIVDNHYTHGEQLHYWVITFFDDSDKDKLDLLKQDCTDAKWGLLSFYDVIDWYEGMPYTGSDLFDEFWLKTWY